MSLYVCIPVYYVHKSEAVEREDEAEANKSYLVHQGDGARKIVIIH